MNRRVYVASSWRNLQQPEIVAALRTEGHEVYDFRNPAPGNAGFRWTAVDSDAANWTPLRYATLVTEHPVAAHGFVLDKAALDWCDTCVLALPCGRSAHLEAGYAIGQGKQVVVLLHEDKFEPELMYLLADQIVMSIGDLLVYLRYEKHTCGLTHGWDAVKPIPPQ